MNALKKKKKIIQKDERAQMRKSEKEKIHSYYRKMR